MGNIARTYADKGKLKEAEQLEIQVLDMRKKLLGAEHPNTLLSMANLARAYADKVGRMHDLHTSRDKA
jgi:hypothetical protein